VKNEKNQKNEKTKKQKNFLIEPNASKKN